jgi:hypothetical protein
MENIKFVNGKLYGVCDNCGEIVRINKPIIGSLHLCRSEEERAELAKYPQLQGMLEDKIKENIKILNN